MTLKRILLIAPDHPDLNWPVELEQVGSKHQVVPLLGRVDQERVTRATTGQRFDVIHVASHSGDDGVQLSDGWLSKEQFGQLARHVRCDLVFFNSCNSARLGQYMIDIGIMTVIDWTIPVVDGDAIRTAAYFYDEWAADEDLRRAYNKVNPRDGSLSFLAGQGYIEDLIRPVVEQVNQVGQQVGTLATAVATQGKALRWVVGAVIAAIVLALVLVASAGSATGQDGTIPSVTLTPSADSGTSSVTNTPLPGCEASGGNPQKCTPSSDPPTATFVPTAPPSPESPTATFVPTVGLETATPTENPVSVATSTPEPTNTPKPRRTATDTPTRAPTWTPTTEGSTQKPEDGATATAESTRVLLPTVTEEFEPTLVATRTSTPRPGLATLEPCQ